MSERGEGISDGDGVVRDVGVAYETRSGDRRREEVPPGYKRTEVGVIPEEWKLKPFLSIASLATGQVDPRIEPFRSLVLVAPDHIEEKTGRLLQKKTAYEQQAISGKFQFHPGDVVYSKIRPYLRKAILSNFKGMCSADMYPLTPLDGVSSEFLFAIILSEPFSKFAESVSARSGIPKLNRTELAQYWVALPPLPEQRAIASALSDADALIQSLDRLIAKKRAIKQAAMQQLLMGRVRLDGFRKKSLAGYKQTHLGMIPKDWRISFLSEIGETFQGLTYSPENVSEYGTLVLRSSNIQRGKLAFEDNVFVNMPVPSRAMVKEGDILICVRNGSRQLIGKCAKIDRKSEGCAFGAFMSVFRAKNSGFAFYQIQSDVIQKQIQERMGATINQITNKDMCEFTIPVPVCENEQRAIATVLSDMDAEIEKLERRRDKAQKIKQGMMQQLLTGRVRLV